MTNEKNTRMPVYFIKLFRLSYFFHNFTDAHLGLASAYIPAIPLVRTNYFRMSFLVLEGLDGSGKSTQNRLLRRYLDKNNIKYKYLHFPRTGTGIFGELIAMFLRGELGEIGEVNPYLVSLIYAADREDAKKMLQAWLSDGYLVLVDRYVMSNVAFQCAKLKTDREKKQLKDWIFHLEYTRYGIPRPDLNIFLDVPFEFTREKLTSGRSGDERDYLKGNMDIHEADLEFQQKVRQIYLDESKKENTLKLVSCHDEQMRMLKPEEIFQKIIGLLKRENFLINQ
ncbi:MAG: dTMP kinase [Bacteroidales bacterium]